MPYQSSALINWTCLNWFTFSAINWHILRVKKNPYDSCRAASCHRSNMEQPVKSCVDQCSQERSPLSDTLICRLRSVANLSPPSLVGDGCRAFHERNGLGLGKGLSRFRRTVRCDGTKWTKEWLYRSLQHSEPVSHPVDLTRPGSKRPTSRAAGEEAVVPRSLQAISRRSSGFHAATPKVRSAGRVSGEERRRRREKSD